MKIDMDQWKRTKSPAASAYMHGQLSLGKDANVLLGGGLWTDSAGEASCSWEEMNLDLTAHANINSVRNMCVPDTECICNVYINGHIIYVCI